MLKLTQRRSWMLAILLQAAVFPGAAIHAAEEQEPAKGVEPAADEVESGTKGEAETDAPAKPQAKKGQDAGQSQGRRQIRIVSPDGRTFEIVGPEGVARLFHELTPEEEQGVRARGYSLRLKDGKVQTIRPDDAKALIGDLTARMGKASQAPRFIIGVSVSEAPEVVLSQLDMSGVSAVVVDSVLDESPAAKAGIQKLDLILKANDGPVGSPTDLTRAVKESEGKEIELVLMRNGKELKVAVTPRTNEDANQPTTASSDGMIHFGPAFMDRRMMMGAPGEPLFAAGPLLEEMKALRKDVAELKKLVEELKTAK